MGRIKSKGTVPEVNVRRAAHALGLRFRLHRKDLPGSPDLVFVRRKTALFVHGCFWHQHEKCRRASVPKSRPEYWLPKLSKNVTRDALNARRLIELGWRVEIIWECEAKTVADAEAALLALEPF